MDRRLRLSLKKKGSHVGNPSIVTALIPLPMFYNPDEQGMRKEIAKGKFRSTAMELTRHFKQGAVLYLFRNDQPEGFWWDRGIVDEDVLALVEVDLPDTHENRDWLVSYAKNVLLERFQQKAIYIKFVGPVEVETVPLEHTETGLDAND